MQQQDLATTSVTYPGGLGRGPLEPSAAQMRRMAAAVSERLVQFAEGLPSAPAVNLDDVPRLVAGMREPAPEQGSELDGLLDVVMEAAARGIETAGPGFLAYVPGGGIYTAAVADFLACGINRYVALWNQAPVLAAMEWTSVRWLCDLFGYPGAARGVLTSGGSMSTLGAIVPARQLSVWRALCQQPGPRERRQGGLGRRLPARERAHHPDRPPLPHGRGRAAKGDSRRHGPGKAPVLRRRNGGDHEHRGDRSAARARGRRPLTRHVVPRGRRLRRLLPAHRARPRKAEGDRRGGLDHGRSTQGTLPPLRDGGTAGQGWRPAAGRL